jgi:hypothetical protein
LRLSNRPKTPSWLVRILLDECLPKRQQNGDLLRLAERQFEVFLAVVSAVAKGQVVKVGD